MWGMRGSGSRRELPPPIPLLIRRENRGSHMPWVLKRQYTGDGRLILTEERVSHHEFFLAHRSNGRLMLHLVALDSDEDECAAAADGGGGVGKCCNYGRDSGFMFGVAVSGGSLRSGL